MSPTRAVKKYLVVPIPVAKGVPTSPQTLPRCKWTVGRATTLIEQLEFDSHAPITNANTQHHQICSTTMQSDEKKDDSPFTIPYRYMQRQLSIEE